MNQRRVGQNRWIRLTPVLGLWVALVFGFTTDASIPPSANGSCSAEAEWGTDIVRSVEDRDRILTMVREHRRRASDSWREHLTDAIYQEAVSAEVDPLLVASIVATESSFKSRVVSRAGAVGLMQLRPFVARDVADRNDVEWSGLETLHSPRLNVRLGIVYYKELVQRFDGDATLALAAYNRGPSRVSGQLRNGTYRAGSYAETVLRLYASLDRDRRETPTRV